MAKCFARTLTIEMVSQPCGWPRDAQIEGSPTQIQDGNTPSQK